MPGYGVNRAAKVVFMSFGIGAVYMIALISTAQYLIDMSSSVAAFLVFAAVVIGIGLITRTLANRLLFDRSMKPDFYVCCGARNPQPGAALNAATWPFAKLSATKTSLRFESPWSDCAWTHDGTSPTIKRTKLFAGEFIIQDAGASAKPAIPFMVGLWRVGRVERALRSLGYNVVS